MFSDLLKSLREQKRISQTQLAREIEVSAGNISDWETGRSKPGYVALSALARFFEVSADYLLELDQSPVKTGIDLTGYKASHGLSCDDSPLEDEESDLVAMYRLLPDHKKEDAFDIIYTLYQKHVEKKKGSIYWTYKADKVEHALTGGGSELGDKSGGGIA